MMEITKNGTESIAPQATDSRLTGLEKYGGNKNKAPHITKKRVKVPEI